MNIPLSKVKRVIPDFLLENIEDDSVIFEEQTIYVGRGKANRAWTRCTCIDGSLSVTVRSPDRWEAKCASYAWLSKLRNDHGTIKPESVKKNLALEDVEYWLFRISELEEKKKQENARTDGIKKRGNERVTFNCTEVMELKETFKRMKEALED